MKVINSPVNIMSRLSEKNEMVRKKIEILESRNLIEILRDCPDIMSRLDKLTEFLPEIMLWCPMNARKIVYELYLKYALDFGVCQFYSIEGDEQFCSADGEKCICLCAIPEAYCVIRDKDSDPKYPEFDFIKALEILKD